MAITKLTGRQVEKVWGRRDLPAAFGARYSGAEPLGEIWFEHPDGDADLDLLVKYLFTSEKLSIQVHPDDRAAAEAGLPRGKDEAWFITRADPGAIIGIGLRERLSREELRRAALDGSIEQLLDWRGASAGDVYYSPAGTVHALGPGLVLIEVQQNSDVTYRLYDYGRDRELHLDRGIEAADPAPYVPIARPAPHSDRREVLAQGSAFVLERWSGPAERAVRAHDQPVWLVPLEGESRLGAERLEAGSVWLVEGEEALTLAAGSVLLAAYSGCSVREDLLSSDRFGRA